MKPYYKLIILLLVNFTHSQIFAQNEKAGSIVRINPEKAIGGKLSDLFEEIKFIPLENSSKSLFGEIPI